MFKILSVLTLITIQISQISENQCLDDVTGLLLK